MKVITKTRRAHYICCLRFYFRYTFFYSPLKTHQESRIL